MLVAVLAVCGGALAQCFARALGSGASFGGLFWALWSVALAGLTVYVAGAWRAAGRATEKRDFESYRAGHDAGTRAFASAGSDELNWFDYALRVFYRRYCADERLLSNWVRATVESKLEGPSTQAAVTSVESELQCQAVSSALFVDSLLRITRLLSGPLPVLGAACAHRAHWR